MHIWKHHMKPFCTTNVCFKKWRGKKKRYVVIFPFFILMVFLLNNVWFFPNSHFICSTEIYSFLSSHDCIYLSLLWYSILLSIFCNSGLVNCLSLNVFITPLTLKDNFAGYSNLGSYFVSVFEIHQSILSWPLGLLLGDLLLFW
jgi:hypothetical protein